MFVTLDSVPLVTIALHGEPSLHAFHDEVDPKTMVRRVTDGNLCSDVVSALGDQPEHITLEIRTEALLGFVDGLGVGSSM